VVFSPGEERSRTVKLGPISTWNVERVLVLGDAHGDGGFMEYALAAAAREGCQVLVQLGDFGYWEHTLSGRNFLDRVNRAAEQCQVPVLFVDGNHENHDLLRERQLSEEVSSDGTCWVRQNVAWLTRGMRWSWGGVSFGAVGGAASVDRSLRTQGWTWWPEEVLVRSDVEGLCGEPLDVLFSHDAPSLANMRSKRSFPEEDLERCAKSRGVLDAVVRSTRPQRIFHGHWHLRHHTVAGFCEIDGLAHERAPFSQAAVILEVPSLEVLSVESRQAVDLRG
jgi:hypothetical protein